MSLDDLFERHEHQFARVANAEVQRYLDLLENARLQLQNEIASLDDFDRNRVLALLSQIDQIERQVIGRINQTESLNRSMGKISVPQFNENMNALGINLQIGFDAVNSNVLENYAALELTKIKGITQDSINTIRSVLFTKVGVKGENPRVVAKELAGQEGLFTRNYGRLENIVRTESSHVYNTQKMNAIKHAVDLGISLHKKAVETIDNKRNHPISQVLNGKVQVYDQPFRVSVAEVAARAKVLHRSKNPAAGVFWKQDGGYFVGNQLPAHYMDRGVMVATKEPVPEQDA